jgi:AcrR family transcriptional regulator
MGEGDGANGAPVEGSDGALGAVKLRPMRADAVENRRRILEAAEEVFAAQGVSAPIDAVADRAGVGVGTLYRHFATKEALFEAIVVTRLQELAEAATGAGDAPDAGEAFFSFLAEFAGKVTNKHDLIDALGDAGIEIKSRCSEMAAELEVGVARMLRRAQDAGAVRPGVSAQEVLGLVVGLCQAAAYPGLDEPSRRRMLEVVCDGLRTPGAAGRPA